MEEVNYSGLHMEYLPTEERRQYTKRLRKYAEYFQAQMDLLESRTVKDRILDNLQKEKKKKQLQNFQIRMTEYGALVGKIISRSNEEFMLKTDEIVRHLEIEDKELEIGLLGVEDGEVAEVGKPIAALSGAVGGASGAGCLFAGAIAGGIGMLNDFSGLSDKQQAAIYKKAFETAMRLLYESDVPEEKIKSALSATMSKIGQIKEKYSDIADDDLLAQKIQDECVVEIIEGIEQATDYNKFQRHIEKTIGTKSWNKMTQNAQIFLITAELLYHQWKIYGDDIDFSPICMSVSKALEVEVTRRYFIGYLKYLKKNKEELPEELIIRDGNRYREKSEEEFMLGNMTGITGYAVYLDTETVKLVGRLTDANQRFLKYAKAELFLGKSEGECVRLIKKHAFNIKKVCVQYRNPSAHKQKVTKVSARECLDYMIDIKKVMGEMLDECNW